VTLVDEFHDKADFYLGTEVNVAQWGDAFLRLAGNPGSLFEARRNAMVQLHTPRKAASEPAEECSFNGLECGKSLAKSAKRLSF
jgi:hypothetical protein